MTPQDAILALKAIEDEMDTVLSVNAYHAVQMGIEALEKQTRMKGTIIEHISKEEFGTLAICAVRYCQGRQTYMPSLVQEIVKSHIDMIDGRDLNVMIDDCEFQERCNLYGDEKIDKPGWIRWKQFLLEERKKREGDANDSR